MILLTGGTGFVGRHLTAQFLADNRRVRVLSRDPGRCRAAEGLACVKGDIIDGVALRAALRDVRTVVHAAAVLPGGATREPDFEDVNARGTGVLARAAREMGVRRFVHVGSAGVYGDGRIKEPHRECDEPNASTPYERSKLSAERALASVLEGSDVKWTILRPQGLYGHDRPATAEFFRAVARRRLWFHGPVRVLVHPTHIADLVSAVRLVLDRDDLHAEVINVAGDRALEYRELISLVGRCVGHEPLQLCAPRWIRSLARLSSRAWGTLGSPPEMLARLSRESINRTVSIEKARRLLGFVPMELEQGIDQTAKELRRAGSL